MARTMAQRIYGPALAIGACLALAIMQPVAAQSKPELAYRFVEYASAAFCDAPEVLRWDCPPATCILQQTAGTNATAFITTRRTAINSYVAFNDRLRLIIVGFRGTDNPRNVLVDARFLKAPYAGAPADAMVHKGFYNAWTEASEQIVPEVNRLLALYPSFTVACVGHSLGGALAVHCAADLRQRGVAAVSYTYGQPRVGNAPFSAWYSSVEPNSVRVTAYGDIFTQLPPQAFDYRYQPTEVFIAKNGTLTVCDNTGEDETCSNSVPIDELNSAAHAYYLGITFGDCYLQ